MITGMLVGGAYAALAVGAMYAGSYILGVGPAHGDAQDDRYLAALSAQGVTGDPAALIADGRNACASYGSAALTGYWLGLQAQGFSNPQIQNILLDGLRAYCPEKAPGI
jgi:hypothetical protein